ncbi:MAG TPA: amino acid hydroxylase [Candidatus Paceibacterota bacterium]|nr:amino acid hydroxylase [Candidatus Paceibacterota bacterium]
MATATQVKLRTKYSVEDHATWARLFARQKALVADYACKEFLAGSKKLALDSKHVPDQRRVSARINRMTGWKLSSAGNITMSMEDWFVAMKKRSFPVTDYIRKPEHFDYSATPDLFHEYFGHLPFLTDKKFAAMAQKFGDMCSRANKRQLLHISRIWSLGVEFGMIKEKGKIKFLGAGLLSSYGESKHAMNMIKKGKVVPFDLKTVIATSGRTYEYHKKYFIVDTMSDIMDALTAYGKKEGLVH